MKNNNTSNVFIYGVPGTGKTHYAGRLSKELGIPVIEGDRIKRNTEKESLKECTRFFI